MSPQPTLDETETADKAKGVVIRCIAVGPLRTNCYAVHATDSRRSLLIDPGGDATAILNAVADLDVTAILLTHTHWDHVEALAEVKDALGAPVAAHPADRAVWPHERDHLARHGHWDAGTGTQELLGAGCRLQPRNGTALWDGTVDIHVAHRTVLHADTLEATVLHTPGHTPGGICLALALLASVADPDVDAAAIKPRLSRPSSASRSPTRRYRSLPTTDAPDVTGCIVKVTLAADGPDPARAWVDAVIEGIRSEPEPIPGLIGAHFHINANGTSIINYAEWTSEQAHRQALAGGDIEGIGQTASPPWSHVLEMPHITPLSLEYYRPNDTRLPSNLRGTPT